MTVFSSAPKAGPVWRRTVLVLLIAFVALLVAAWFSRNALAEFGLGRWCAQKNWRCVASVDHVGVSGLTLTDLDVRIGPATPFRASGIDVKWRWSGLRPILHDVSLTEPTIRARLDRDGLDLYGLEVLGGSGPSETSAPPAEVTLSVTGLAVEVSTSAGIVRGEGNVQGTYPDNLRAEATLPPLTLSEGAHTLELHRGHIDVELIKGQIAGKVEVDLPLAEVEGLSSKNAYLELEMRNLSDHSRLAWSVRADHLSYRQMQGDELSLIGEAQVNSLTELTTGDSMSITDSLTMMVTAADVWTETFAASGFTASADLMRLGDGHVGGPVAMRSSTLRTPWLTSGPVSISGDADYESATSTVSFTNRMIADAVDVADEYVHPALEMLGSPAPFAGHARKMRDMVELAAADLILAIETRVTYRDADNWTLTAERPSVFRDRAGLSLTFDPIGGRPWLMAKPGEYVVSGLVSLAGGGGLNADLVLDLAEYSRDRIAVRARSVALRPWKAEGLSLAARLDQLSYDSISGTLELGGEVTALGDVFGLSALESTLFGDIRAARSPRGWLVEVPGEGCIGLQTEGVRAASLSVGQMSLTACPKGGRLVDQGARGPNGTLGLGDIDIPLATNDVVGTLHVQDSEISWSADGPLALTLTAQSLRGPVALGGKTLIVETQTPQLVFEADNGPLRLGGVLMNVTLGGDLIPARTSARRFDFDVNLLEDGLAGQATLSNVRLSDLNSDPLFEPLIGDFNAIIARSQLQLDGPLRLERRGDTIGDAELTLNLASLNGNARVVSRPLIFSPDGLRPSHISDLLRGVMTNASGRVDAVADIDIVRGQPRASADITLTDLAFQTVPFDRVSGVNGKIVFDNVLAMTTLPSQRLEVGAMRAGVPLTDGALVFQLKGPNALALEHAVWPFAGGMLRVEPAFWEMGGPRQDVSVVAERIDLSELVDALGIPDLEAAGSVSGRFPISVRGASILIDQARLVADAEGAVAYTGQAAETASDAAANPYADYAFDALRDFRFTVMELGADGNLIDDVTLSLRLEGSNPNVLEGQSIHFNVEVTSPLGRLIQTADPTRARQWVAQQVQSRPDP